MIQWTKTHFDKFKKKRRRKIEDGKRERKTKAKEGIKSNQIADLFNCRSLKPSA